MLYASELAACASMNPFQTTSDIAEKIWKRQSPKSYAAAVARNDLLCSRMTIEDFLTGWTFTERSVTPQKLREKSSLTELQTLLLELDDNMTDELRARIDAIMQMERGRSGEKEILDKLEQTRGVRIEQRNDRFLKSYISIMSKKTGQERSGFLLGGRVDGVSSDGTLIEVKERRHKLFHEIPVYEKVQLHAYMCLTGKKECQLVQRYQEETDVSTVHFDDRFWYDVILRATTFCANFQAILNSEARQDVFLKNRNKVVAFNV